MGIMISEAMYNEHVKLKNVFNRFENSVRELEPNMDLFNEFKWNIEKHFLVEEKAIFELCNNACGDKISEIFDLMKEHGEILNLINDCEDNLDEGISVEIDLLKKMLTKHADFEDEVFYPLLDEKLNEERKQEILDRINEIVR